MASPPLSRQLNASAPCAMPATACRPTRLLRTLEQLLLGLTVELAQWGQVVTIDGGTLECRLKSPGGG